MDLSTGLCYDSLYSPTYATARTSVEERWSWTIPMFSGSSDKVKLGFWRQTLPSKPAVSYVPVDVVCIESTGEFSEIFIEYWICTAPNARVRWIEKMHEIWPKRMQHGYVVWWQTESGSGEFKKRISSKHAESGPADKIKGLRVQILKTSAVLNTIANILGCPQRISSNQFSWLRSTGQNVSFGTARTSNHQVADAQGCRKL